MPSPAVQMIRGLFDRDTQLPADAAEAGRVRLIARWLFLRALGLLYFSAFYSLYFQIAGLIGPRGILPADAYLAEVAHGLGLWRFWFAPTLLWCSASGHVVVALSVAGMVASLLVVLNLWPRCMLAVCLVCYLSFIAAAQDFASYQSDGMLLEAGFLSLFLAPRGLRPGWGARTPAPLASTLLLLWEWFRIYFESGVVKLQSGDPTWRNLTAMDEYYQNGPLPSWIGWYVQHLPEWFHRATAGATLVLELGLVFMAFLPRRWRIACFCIVTVWQAGVILTANYAFLNYLVLALGVLLLDDALLLRFVPGRWRMGLPLGRGALHEDSRNRAGVAWRPMAVLRVAVTATVLAWIAYATSLPLLQMFWRSVPLPEAPVRALEPFRIANEYGLFAVMTPHRFEIEFQGSADGKVWTAYPFRYKPQDPATPPGLYAPYQPRFDWNLWFASLGAWPQYPFVPRTEELLLRNDPAVLQLFAGNPFAAAPPRYARAVLWQYWFTTMAQKRATRLWWRRSLLGTYAPTLGLAPGGEAVIMQDATLTPTPR